MLVLSRKVGEWFQIADNVRVQVVDVRGDRVRLGIEAPREVQVTRPDAKNQQPRLVDERSPAAA